MLKAKKIIVLVATIFGCLSNVFAQSYTLTPDDTINISGMMEDMQTLSIQQVNTTNDSLHLKWKKVSASVPANWEATICDNSFCNTTLTDSGIMNPVAKGEYGLLLLHITPHVNYGTCTVRYVVWDIANPMVKDTLTYILTVKNTIGITSLYTDKQFNLFPNPANDALNIFIAIQKQYTISIFDYSGKNVYSGSLDSKFTSIPSENFPDAIYFISILDDTKIVYSGKLIVQH